MASKITILAFFKHWNATESSNWPIRPMQNPAASIIAQKHSWEYPGSQSFVPKIFAQVHTVFKKGQT